MKVGIYFTAGTGDGGVYQYSCTFLNSLAKIPNHRYTIINTSPDLPAAFRHHKLFSVIDLAVAQGSQSQFTRLKIGVSNFLSQYFPHLISWLYQLHLFGLVQQVIKFSQKKNIRQIDDLDLDAICFPAAADLSYLIKTPTIVAIHDLEHRTHPQFSEVSSGGRWEYRENSYRKICNTARQILVDSFVGKEDVMKYYRVQAERIVVLPFLGSSHLLPDITHNQVKKILTKYHLHQPYLYYPAKFWPHKNHLRLVAALQLLHTQGIKIHLVLTGAKDAEFSTYPQVMEYARKHRLNKLVTYLGYVDDLTISALYRGAMALVMPTYFGPTNLPIIEAWKMGTPVITSDIRGCRDQVGDAGMVANPDSAQDIAQKIGQLWTQTSLRQKLIKNGRKKLEQWTENDFARTLGRAISQSTRMLQ